MVAGNLLQLLKATVMVKVKAKTKKNRGQKMKMLRIRQVENLVTCLGTFIRAWVFSFWPGHFLKGKCPGYVKTAQTMPNGLL